MKFPTADNCIACHQNNDHKRMNWAFSEHKKAKLECRDCHGIHSPKIKELNVGMWKSDKNSQLCISCHKDVAARMTMPSHHPVKEGGLSCTSCHDPHSSKNTPLASKNELCFKCHQNVRGPKVFEHAPVVEDCTYCHNPHGSPNRRLLQLAQPMQCLQCHSLASNFHGGVPRGAQLRSCTNCHSAIHGSHSDPKLKY
jgi:DmsE family decaheme c-type cytochrome